MYLIEFCQGENLKEMNSKFQKKFKEIQEEWNFIFMYSGNHLISLAMLVGREVYFVGPTTKSCPFLEP